MKKKSLYRSPNNRSIDCLNFFEMCEENSCNKERNAVMSDDFNFITFTSSRLKICIVESMNDLVITINEV